MSSSLTAAEPRRRDRRFRGVTRMGRATEPPGWAGRPLPLRTRITPDEPWHDPWADRTRVYDIVTTVANVPVTILGTGSVSPSGRRGRRYHLDSEELDRTATGGPATGARWQAQRV